MRRGRRVRYSELTSLLDVLFILVFAAMIHAAALVQEARSNRASAAKPAPKKEAPRPKVQRPDRRARAIHRLLERLHKRGIVFVRISANGVLSSIEVEGDGGVRVSRISVPLLQPDSDPSVALTYLGNANRGLRVCSLVRLNLGKKNLSGQVVAFLPEKPLAKLSYALVEGLKRDQERCHADERGMGVLLDPKGAP